MLTVQAYTGHPQSPLIQIAHFVQLLFEAGIYFFGKPRDINDGWIMYIQVRQWRLLDTVSSMRSLSVLLSAVGTTHTTQTVLALAWWLSSESIRTRVHVPRLLAAATIRGQRLFHSRASDCAATIWGRRLFEGGIYSKKYGISKTIQQEWKTTRGYHGDTLVYVQFLC